MEPAKAMETGSQAGTEGRGPAAASRPGTEARPESPLEMALRVVDRPLGIVRSLPREGWQNVDPDVLHELSERITTLSARLASETQKLLALIYEFDRLEGWKAEGYGSCAEWLAHRTWIDKVTARERVRVAGTACLCKRSPWPSGP